MWLRCVCTRADLHQQLKELQCRKVRVMLLLSDAIWTPKFSAIPLDGDGDHLLCVAMACVCTRTDPQLWYVWLQCITARCVSEVSVPSFCPWMTSPSGTSEEEGGERGEEGRGGGRGEEGGGGRGGEEGGRRREEFYSDWCYFRN